MEDEYLAGKHSVIEALRAGRPLHKIWMTEQSRKSLQIILNEAKKIGLTIQFVDKRKLDQMAGASTHQGVVAQAAAQAYVEVADLLAAAKSRNETPLLLILDEIEDPHNLGSILRTADCSGVHGVIIPKRRSVGLTSTVAKISVGALEYVPVARVANLTQTIKDLKEQGIWIAGADVSAEKYMYEADFSVPLALVIGSEGKGIGRLIKENCDFLVKIPLRGHIESLNASVAAGILMYESVRQRGTFT